MSPKRDNHEPDAKADVTVDIPHDEKSTPPAPTTPPPLRELESFPPRPINITDNPVASPVVPPVVPATIVEEEYHERDRRQWLVTALYVLAALIVAALIVFGGRWVYRSIVHHNKKTTTPAGTNQTKTPSAPSATSQSPASGNSASGSNTAAGQLPNNGPGDVVAIFVGAALAASGLHFIYNLRKQN